MTLPANVQCNGATVTVSLVKIVGSPQAKELYLRAVATKNGARGEVLQLVYIGLGRSKVFDYTYFINNFGWYQGGSSGNIVANGDVRSNGNFDMTSKPLINGDITASTNTDLGVTGTVTMDSAKYTAAALSAYVSSTAYNLARPGSPPSTTSTTKWAMGYPGTSTTYNQTPGLDMPYLGNLTLYEDQATASGATLKVGSTTVTTNGIYSGAGPDGVVGTADDGMLILVGTTANPITLNGPVVVRGDVVIKGVVTGQGTIYSGRNIHIADNITYKNGPSWSKPDNNPANTANTNRSKDLLALCAKGNIVVGDYTNSTWSGAVATYLKPTFTKPYTTDSGDATLGYDTDRNSANGYKFDGNYTGTDGGKTLYASGTSLLQRNRLYYESANEKAFKTTTASNSITRIDAVCYTNHAFAGKVGALTINGALISRDEAIAFSGNVKFNWDIRIGSRSRDASTMDIDIYLPKVLTMQTEYWRN